MTTYKHFREKDYGNLANLDKEILQFWETNSVMHKTLEANKDKESFTFYEGPPTANGKPGVHHILGRTIKDLVCRYKTMCGYSVDRRAGWDTHGLPVELEVEKELGLSSREAIHEFGIDKYNEACKNSVLKYTKLWNDLTLKMGYWVDLDNPYVTYDNNYIESLWWLIKTLHEKDLLYLGYKIHWYSPGTQTVLSSHEVSLGYKDVQDPSITVRFALEGQENTYFLAWTTTPWTLISNAALAVGPSIEYVKIAVNDEFLILAKDRLVIIEDDYEIVATYTGTDLSGIQYQPLFTTFADHEDVAKLWRVLTADYVSVGDGTGIVHIAPAFGGEDYEAATAQGIPLLNPVKPNGEFEDSVELVGGLWFKDADKVIIKALKERGVVFDHKTILHSYPHDWRKGTPLLNYPVKSWFVKTTKFKQRLIDLNETVNWQPASVGKGRFGEWLKNNVDWALSRHRFWGTPLPIWVNDEDPEDYVVVGSIEQLRELAGESLPNDATLDLHRPYIDDVTWPSPKGGTMRRTPEIIDVWFDSGAMPFAQWHYPFENKDVFERNFPADFIAEGVDQTRGWFYTLHALASLVMDSVAYKNVVVNGLLLDEKGDKMSKSKGNTVDPFEALSTHGADAVRWYLMSVNPPWEDARYSDKGIVELRRKLFGTIENVYSFFVTYTNIDQADFRAANVPLQQRRELDKWIISRLNSTVQDCRNALDSYNPTDACKSIEKFIDDLSNWYLRRSRNVFWSTKKVSEDSGNDKVSAYLTIWECLHSCARLIAPIAPFYSEWLFGALNQDASDSVHLATYPEYEQNKHFPDIETKMQLARNIASTTLALRNKADINVRQPLKRILVVANSQAEIDMVESVADIVQAETNIDTIECIPTSSDIVHRSAKANFKLLGKRLGPKMKLAAAAIAKFSDEQIIQYIESSEITIDLDGESVTFVENEIDVQSKGIEGWIVEGNKEVTVALDIEIDQQLKLRGLSREVVNRIQNLRKSLAFNVADRITITYTASDMVKQAVDAHTPFICAETLADNLTFAAPQNLPDSATEFELDGEQMHVVIEKSS